MRVPPIFLLLACLLFTSNSPAQTYTPGPEAQFSVITCGPGTELYSSFGHSAFRFRDPAIGADWVYNYGTFDFNTPNFYVKFTRGKLPYALGKQQFENFLYTYQLENRFVREQLLDLSPTEMGALLTFLERNNQPENRFYKYDFLFENCATKIPEVLSNVLGPSLEYSFDGMGDPKSFRDLIQENLNWNSWSSFGIDLALGSVIDRKAAPGEYAFLPKYVERQIGNASSKEAPLTNRNRLILDIKPLNPESVFTAAPMFWMLLVLGMTLIITWIDYRNNTRSKVLDFLLLFTTGTAGLVLVFLWFFTDHTATAWNANLLWAFPINLIMAFRVFNKTSHPQLDRKYAGILLILLLLTVGLWIFGIQVFSPVMIPIWLALLIRYLFLFNLKKTLP